MCTQYFFSAVKLMFRIYLVRMQSYAGLFLRSKMLNGCELSRNTHERGLNLMFRSKALRQRETLDLFYEYFGSTPTFSTSTIFQGLGNCKSSHKSFSPSPNQVTSHSLRVASQVTSHFVRDQVKSQVILYSSFDNVLGSHTVIKTRSRVLNF